MKPQYRTLVKMLDLMVGEVECELDASGADEVAGHPVLASKARNVKKANKVLNAAKAWLESKEARHG